MDNSLYLPTEEMRADFELFKSLKTDAERERFQEERKKRFDEKTTAEKNAFLEARDKSLENIENRTDELMLIAKFGEVADVISFSYIARKYFGKSKQWFFQRLNGYNVNGKPAKFTESELNTLSLALQDISDMINKTAFKITC